MNFTHRFFLLSAAGILFFVLAGLLPPPAPIPVPKAALPSMEITDTPPSQPSSEKAAVPATIPATVETKPMCEPAPETYCGLSIEGCRVTQDQVASGRTLTDLLRPFGVSAGTVYALAVKAEAVFDVRRIKAGNDYTLIFRDDKPDRPSHFIYHPTAADYVVFRLEPPLNVFSGQKQITTRLTTAKGEIHTNLWQAAQSAGLHPGVIFDLADIFSSTLDFRNFQPGDRFSVCFEKQFVGENSIGTGRIQAARITCSGVTHQAYYYEDEHQAGYFDESGSSLERSFLKCPLRYSRISSGFTLKRFHPIKQKYLPHPGIDFAAPTGTPVRSVGDGVVVFKGRSRSAGNYIKIRHGSFGTSEYLHLSKFPAGIRKNTSVKKGQVIGYVGSTGYATGPHLDLRFKKNGTYVDYRKLKLPRGKSLGKESKQRFTAWVDKMTGQWDGPARIARHDISSDTGSQASNGEVL